MRRISKGEQSILDELRRQCKIYKEVFGEEPPQAFSINIFGCKENLKAIENAIKFGKPLSLYVDLSLEDQQKWERGMYQDDEGQWSYYDDND